MKVNLHRTRLNQSKYEPKKKQNDVFIKELRTVSNRLNGLLTEKICADRGNNASRASNLGVSVTAISTLKDCLREIQPDLDRAQYVYNTPRLLQSIGTKQRCYMLETVRNTFKRHGLKITHYELEGKRSAFFQCVFIALRHAGDKTNENIDKVHEQCKQF